MRKSLQRLLVLFLSLAAFAIAFEGGCSAYRAWTLAGQPPAAREVVHCEYDAELGWVNLPNHVVKSIYGPGLTLTTNSRRMRAAREYEDAKAAGTYRIICLGDSFTMGYGVDDRDTYPAWLERLAPGVEAVNMGLGGYGVDQCYLWYKRDGQRLESDLLVLAVIGDDFARMLPKGKVANQPKPMLELIDGEPTPVNLPVPYALDAPPVGKRFGLAWRHSAIGSWIAERARARERAATAGTPPTPYSEREFVPVAERILERLNEMSEERNQRFVVAYLPLPAELTGKRPAILEDWLDPFLAEQGIPLIDLWPHFKALSPGERQVHYALGHFSRLGNNLAARKMIARIRELDPFFPE